MLVQVVTVLICKLRHCKSIKLQPVVRNVSCELSKLGKASLQHD